MSFTLSTSLSQHSFRRIYSHTGLRGVAAMCVCLWHLLLPDSSKGCFYQAFYKYLNWAGEAVDLFFILSGFVLCWVYCTNSGSVKWGNYFVARAGRIIPLYYLTTVICIPVAIYSYIKHGSTYVGSDFSITLFLNAIMVTGIISGMAHTINMPAWSISVEVFCYIAIFPAFACTYKYIKNKNYGLMLSIIIMLLSTYGLSLCYGFSPLKVLHWQWEYVWLCRGIFGFMAGCFLCAVYNISFMYRPSALLIDVIVLVSIIVFILSLLDYVSWTYRIYVFPFIVFFSAYDKGVSAIFLKNSLLQWLGERSYSIYLWHMPVIFLQIYVCYLLKVNSHRSLVLSLFMLASILTISELSYRYFEYPCREYIRNVSRWKIKSFGM